MFAHPEPDLDGYVWMAKRIAHFEPLAVEQPNPFLYHSHAWVETSKGLVTTKYAPGYPFLLAVFYWLGDDNTMFFLPPLAALLGLVGAYLLFREWMGRYASLAAVFVLSINDQFLFHSGYLLSHTTSLCLVVWGMYFLWRWHKTQGIGAGIGVGLCLGYAITVRHTNLLLAAPVAVALLAALWRSWRVKQFRWQGFAALCGAYALFPVLLAIYQTIIFGAPWITGYALSDEQGAFSWAVLLARHKILLNSAFDDFIFLVLPFGIAGAVVAGRWPDRLMRLLWILPIALLYASYYWYMSHGAAFFRFMLALLPAMVGSAFLLFDQVRASFSGRAVAVTLLCGVMVWHSRGHIDAAWEDRYYHNGGKQIEPVAEFVDKHLEKDAVLFTAQTFHWVATLNKFTTYDLQRFHRYYPYRAFRETKREITPEDMAHGRSPIRQQSRRKQEFRELYANASQADLNEWIVRITRQGLEEGRQVAILDTGRRGAHVARVLPDDMTLELLAEKEVGHDYRRGSYMLRLYVVRRDADEGDEGARGAE